MQGILTYCIGRNLRFFLYNTNNKRNEVIIIKISWIKYEKDEKNFKIPEKLGFYVLKLKDPEETDNTIKNLIQKQYDTFVLSNEIASFSQDIIKKYQNYKNVNIIIAPSKEYNAK